MAKVTVFILPFIFHFINKILNDKKHYPEYEKIENLRQKFLKDQTILTVEDFGAGSSVSKTNKRTVASIAKNAAKQKKYSQLLFRMVNEYKPKTILELGTSLGITTSYLAIANKDATVITLEGSVAVADRAANNFRTIKLYQTLNLFPAILIIHYHLSSLICHLLTSLL